MLRKLILFIPFFFLAHKAQAIETIDVQLSWHHQYEYAGFYAAIAQGYYAQEGLQVNLKPWQTKLSVLDEVLNGNADVSLGHGNLLVHQAKNSNLSFIMANMQRSPVALVSHTPIEKLTDFANKKVMLHPMSGNFIMLNQAEKMGINLQTMPTSGDLRDFINKKTDLYEIYITNEPYQLDQLGLPYFIVKPSDYGIEDYGDILFATQAFVQKNPETVDAFKKATIKGWKYALEHPEEIVDYIMNHYPVKKSREAMLSEAHMTAGYVGPNHNLIGHLDPHKLHAMAYDYFRNDSITESVLNALDYERLIFSAKGSFLTEKEKALLSVYLFVLLVVLILGMISLQVRTKLKQKKQLQNQLLEQAHNNAIMDTTALISHHWRQPLTVLIGYLDILEMKLQQMEIGSEEQLELREYIQAMQKMLDEMNQTIQQFSNLAHTFDETTESFFSLESVIKETCNLYKPYLDSAKIDVDLQIDDANLYGYRKNLMDVLNELIKNSTEAFKQNTIKNAKISIQTRIENQHCIIRLQDNGPGMDKHCQNHAFEAYTSNKSLNGRGLGLYFSKIIITENFNGQINFCTSEKGACIEIKIPMPKVSPDDA